MKSLIITSLFALIMLAGPMTPQLHADDAHHPERAAKKSDTSKSTKQRRPAAKTRRSNQSEIRLGWDPQRA